MKHPKPESQNPISMVNEVDGCPWVSVTANTFEASSSRNPVFLGHEDDDVEVCLGRKPEDRFVVRSVVLSLHSSFKASLSNCWVSGNHGSADEGKITWKYQLRFDEDNGDPLDYLDLLTRAVSQARL